MTETARIYGGSLYDLAAEENLTGEILGQMEQIRHPDHVSFDHPSSISERNLHLHPRL